MLLGKQKPYTFPLEAIYNNGKIDIEWISHAHCSNWQTVLWTHS